jgi:hypothetical protein
MQIYWIIGTFRLESDQYQAFSKRGIERVVPFQDGVHLGQEHKHSGKQAAGGVKTKNQERGRDQILLHKCASWAVHRTSHRLHAGSEVLCRAQFQGAEANLVYGPVSDTQMVAVVHQIAIKMMVVCITFKEKLLNQDEIPILDKGHNGLPFLQVLQINV